MHVVTGAENWKVLNSFHECFVAMPCVPRVVDDMLSNLKVIYFMLKVLNADTYIFEAQNIIILGFLNV